MSSSGNPFHLGLIGWPLGHSLSPVMHTAALQAAGLAGEYRLFPIPPFPKGELEMQDLFCRLKTGEIQGFNVTIPHKQNVLSMLESLTPAAHSIGAVNTISLQNRQLTGDNTDWSGFSIDLESHLPGGTTSNQRQALVLGAGGSARAVIFALQQNGWRVNISARRPGQASQLAKELSTEDQPLTSWPLLQFPDLPDTRLIVNTTPAGMSPEVGVSPWPETVPFPRQAFLYDLIYNPAETTLMKAARAAGLEAVNGLGMLAEQAALAFEIWTGQSIPGEVFRQAAFERTLS